MNLGFRSVHLGSGGHTGKGAIRVRMRLGVGCI